MTTEKKFKKGVWQGSRDCDNSAVQTAPMGQIPRSTPLQALSERKLLQRARGREPGHQVVSGTFCGKNCTSLTYVLNSPTFGEAIADRTVVLDVLARFKEVK